MSGNTADAEITTGFDITSADDFVSVLKEYGKVRLIGDITSDTTLLLDNISGSINLNGYSLTVSSGTGIQINAGNVIIEDTAGTGSITAPGAAVMVVGDGTVTINGGSYKGQFGITAGANTTNSGFVPGHVIINNATVQSTEFTLPVWGQSSLVVNNGNFTATDNAVIGTNGSDEHKGTITVNGGVFNGHISSPSYIACGIYAANGTTFNINGGVFNIYDGVGMVIRSGISNIGEDMVINLYSENGLSEGLVGDSKITISTNSHLVVDEESNYPEGKPVIINESVYTLVNPDGTQYVPSTTV